MRKISKEEAALREQLEKFEQEKALFTHEYKRLQEEDQYIISPLSCILTREISCRFGNSSKEGFAPWPILSNRYQLLSLIGKGGFSEVYKVQSLTKVHLMGI